MARTFIDVEVDASVATHPALAKQLVDVCPVNVFLQERDGRLRLVEANLDERTLCEPAPAGTVRMIELDERGIRSGRPKVLHCRHAIARSCDGPRPRATYRARLRQPPGARPLATGPEFAG